MDNECVVEINGKKYVPIDSLSSGDIRIVIFQRGWVMVGRFDQDGDDCTLSQASVIRRWGTTKGLGEIAHNGPTPKTVLDPCPIVRFHILTTVAMIDCVKGNWRL